VVMFANVEHWALRFVQETSISGCIDGDTFFSVESFVRRISCLVIADLVDDEPHVLVCSGEVVVRGHDETMHDCT
jgi:hypothetical protein